MPEIRFTVYGNPVPLLRPRVVRTKAGQSVTYTPKKSEDWKDWIRHEAWKHRPEKLLDGPLMLLAMFYLQKPKSAPKKRLYPNTRPDFDNLLKAVSDACEGLLYTNDSRIVEAAVSKRYGDPPRVEVSIMPMEAK